MNPSPPPRRGLGERGVVSWKSVLSPREGVRPSEPGAVQLRQPPVGIAQAPADQLFWIPKGLTAHHGAYVRYPAEDLLAIVALESPRAQTIIVGEDLPTVEAGVRERLAELVVLSYRVVLFEPNPPAQYPELALAAVTTHDLPTIAGLWTGADIHAQVAMGREANRAGFDEMRAPVGDGRTP